MKAVVALLVAVTCMASCGTEEPGPVPPFTFWLVDPEPGALDRVLVERTFSSYQEALDEGPSYMVTVSENGATASVVKSIGFWNSRSSRSMSMLSVNTWLRSIVMVAGAITGGTDVFRFGACR